MSVLQYPDGIDPIPLQVWTNAAFDNGESDDSTVKSSWWTQSLESSCSKENLNPILQKPPISIKSPVSNSSPIKPLHSNTVIINSVPRPVPVVKSVIREDEGKIDKEIEEIEKEILRLSSRLEALRLEKAQRSLKQSFDRKGRVVPAKFMEPKPNVKIEEPLSNAKSKINRRGVSLGPSEIYSATKPRLWSKPEVTPVSIQNRRKSCFWKLEEIDELKATKERGKSSSLSPRSRKIQIPKMAATTGGGSKRSLKKEDGVLASIQPKTLFKDGEKSVPNKKPLKPGRIVASRYQSNQSNHQSNRNSSEFRKRSLPDSDKEDANKRAEGSRVKKKWGGIPGESMVYKSDESMDEFLQSAAMMVDVLPKIKTFRCVNETPRNSGAVKRVADLVGKKSFFSIDEDVAEEGEEEEDSVCQVLRFGEDEDDVQ